MASEMPELPILVPPIELGSDLHFTNRLSPGRYIAYEQDDGTPTPEGKYQGWLIVRDIGSEGATEAKRFLRQGGRLKCLLAWAPDGKGIYVIQKVEAQGDAGIAFINLETRESKLVWESEGNPHDPYGLQSCTPSGNALVFQIQREGIGPREDISKRKVAAQIYRMDTGGHNLQILVEETDQKFLWAIDIFWEQNMLVCSMSKPDSRQGEILAIDLTHGELCYKIPPQRSLGLPGHFNLSADGKRLIWDNGSDIWLHDRATGKSRCIAKSGSHPALSPDGKWLAFHNEEHTLDGVMNLVAVNLGIGSHALP